MLIKFVIQSGLQRLIHSTKGNALDDNKFVNTVLAALTTESTLLDTTKSSQTVSKPLVYLGVEGM